MATVLAVYDSDGCVGRCDARCHDAYLPACDCICGGRNHGVGVARAVANTREHVEQLVGPEALAAFNHRHMLNATRVEAGDDITQLDLELGGT